MKLEMLIKLSQKDGDDIDFINDILDALIHECDGVNRRTPMMKRLQQAKITTERLRDDFLGILSPQQKSKIYTEMQQGYDIENIKAFVNDETADIDMLGMSSDEILSSPDVVESILNQINSITMTDEYYESYAAAIEEGIKEAVVYI
jgi:hypothetical protein